MSRPEGDEFTEMQNFNEEKSINLDNYRKLVKSYIDLVSLYFILNLVAFEPVLFGVIIMFSYFFSIFIVQLFSGLIRYFP